jgi:hypothetical protein
VPETHHRVVARRESQRDYQSRQTVKTLSFHYKLIQTILLEGASQDALFSDDYRRRHKQNLPEVANHRAATNRTKGTSVGLLRFTRFLHTSAPSQDVSLKL